jgi:hypothetical protein
VGVPGTSAAGVPNVQLACTERRLRSVQAVIGWGGSNFKARIVRCSTREVGLKESGPGWDWSRHDQETFNAFNPNSAVAVAAKSEEQTFHSEANGLVPLSGQHTSVLCLCSQLP